MHASPDNEIILYQPDKDIKIDVLVKNETVWLTQQQIDDLFGVKQSAISKHLKNIFACGELDESSVYSILEYTASDGKTYKTKFYNLDAILSVGYRVNSHNATLFRQWANKILKEYLLRGYSVNQRFMQLEDDTVLNQLSKREAGIKVDLFCGKISQTLIQDVDRHNTQYPGLTLHKYTKAHDRFLIIDEDVYHIGASLKDLGKKLFAFFKMEIFTGSELLNQLKTSRCN